MIVSYRDGKTERFANGAHIREFAGFKRLAEIRSSPPSAVAGRKVASVNQLDGIKLIFENGSWILVRESGTEPVARLYIEASTASDLEALAKAVRELIA